MDNFENNVVEFLVHPEKKVLVIKGKWGVGKTHIWNNIVEKNTTSLNFSNYSYVSLFGLNDLKELQSTVFYSARPLNQSPKESVVKSNMKKVGNIIKHIPQASKYSSAMSIVENSLVCDYLICIDDLERKSDKLSISSLLGYVSKLSSSSNCKVVLIFNDDTLSEKDKEQINKYREKVIDLELEFSPSSERNIDIEFGEHQHRQMVGDTFKSENLNNIRIIKHIKWNLDGINKFVCNAENAVRQDILITTAILTYVHHEPSILIRANEIERIFSYVKDKPELDSELQKRISAIGYIYYAEHEYEIINYIENGRLDENKFINDIKLLNERQIKGDISSKLKNIWGFYNNNFICSGEEVISGLIGFLELHMDAISIRELTPITETLSEIDSSFDEQYWLDKYILLHLDLADSHILKKFESLTTDPELLVKIKDKLHICNEHHSLYMVLNKIVTKHGWNTEDEIYLGSHNVEMLYNFLITDTNKDLMAVVREIIRFFPAVDGDTATAVFGRNLHNALIKIAGRSDLDTYRIKHFFNLKV